MEIQALLLSNSISNDVVLENIYKHLWKLKGSINPNLKQAITQDHYKLKKIVMKYYNDTSLSRDDRHTDFFLAWLENDLLGVLNDDRPFMDGLTENLKRECPGVTMDKLVSYESVNDLPDKVYWLWTLMTPEKKRIMYERTVE